MSLQWDKNSTEQPEWESMLFFLASEFGNFVTEMKMVEVSSMEDLNMMRAETMELKHVESTLLVRQKSSVCFVNTKMVVINIL